jgi:glutathione S-transferase
MALDRLTLADIALAPIVARCLDFPVERPTLPNVNAWCRQIGARPSFQVATGTRPSTLAA